MPACHVPKAGTQYSNPERPCSGAGGLTQRGRRNVEAVFHERVMKRPKDGWPGQHGPSARAHLQHVSKRRPLRSGRDHFKAVKPIESVWRTKSEAHAPAWLVGVHLIPDWAVPAHGPNLQRSIETHWGPEKQWPQPVGRRPKRVEQGSNLFCRRREAPLMNVANRDPCQ
jgi:hypothetical protein